jgi:hypothetical protein
MVDLGYADAKRRGRQKAVGFAAVYQLSHFSGDFLRTRGIHVPPAGPFSSK